ncbi:MAG TPA: oxygen-dependent coproporphyrinogen oxidase, partial [Gemmataceae bacterium]|nr:oxygen-dependent coproporphyrinogen oxidase [Gemmataceae bacterium]
MRDRAAAFFRDLQDRICRGLEALDGPGRFREDLWQRKGGGGGRTRILAEGGLFEKAGVNFSEVHGEMSEEFATQVPGEGREFYATGVSLVLHPRSPMVPTVHSNFRYIAKGDRQWFGGVADLTPYYPVREDVVHFHRTWKAVCDRHLAVADYRRMKEDCDRYFFLAHRDEARGVGGIFFDYVGGDMEAVFAFVQDAGDSFLDAYVPIAERRRNKPYGEPHREWQLFRRGRYVEFNLIYDRGTLFGLKTGGRTESILMSLPPLVKWGYDLRPEP